MPISLAIKKRGKESFTMELLDTATSLIELNRLESQYAKQLDTFSPNGYNLKAGSGLGAMAEDVKRKISASNTGKKLSPEHRRHLSESHKGYKVTEETKVKLSAFWKGKRAPQSTYEAARVKCAKSYKLLDPLGHELYIVDMKKFCSANGLSRSKMCEVARGRKATYRGWKVLATSKRGEILMKIRKELQDAYSQAPGQGFSPNPQRSAP